MKSNPLLPPPAVAVVAAASAEHEKHNDNQNGSHSFLQKCASGNFPPACGFGVTTSPASESTHAVVLWGLKTAESWREIHIPRLG
jgi:hypothetical protein